MGSRDDQSTGVRPTAGGGGIHDRRTAPPGVVPRHLQMWLMIGIALVILTIILFTGQPAPTTEFEDPTASGTPSSLSPARVRAYQERLTARAARPRQDVAEPPIDEPREARSLELEDPLAAERRRLEYDSLFAAHVAFSRRPSPVPSLATGPRPALTEGGESSLAMLPTPEAFAAWQQAQWSAPRFDEPGEASVSPDPVSLPPLGQVTAGDTPSIGDTAAITPVDPLHRILEGRSIDAVLLNRLDGTFSGPVQCLVTTPVYAHGRQHVVIPQGARVLGSASAVETWGDSRLAIRFHRLILPDGRSHSLNRFQGLNQIGETGLRDRVNRHYWQVFGASLAIGALSGLSQINTQTGFSTYSAADGYRQAAGASLASSTGRVLDRFLNVLPTITIREGHRIKIYLTNDLELPAYESLRPLGSPPSSGTPHPVIHDVSGGPR